MGENQRIAAELLEFATWRRRPYLLLFGIDGQWHYQTVTSRNAEIPAQPERAERGAGCVSRGVVPGAGGG